jgi:hypothetical protein
MQQQLFTCNTTLFVCSDNYVLFRCVTNYYFIFLIHNVMISFQAISYEESDILQTWFSEEFRYSSQQHTTPLSNASANLNMVWQLTSQMLNIAPSSLPTINMCPDYEKIDQLWTDELSVSYSVTYQLGYGLGYYGPF